VDHEFWSDQAQFWDEFGQFWELVDQFWELVDQFWELVDQFWELVDGEEGKSVSEPLPPLGAGCHSATKTSIILSVRIVENFFWVMQASMNSS